MRLHFASPRATGATLGAAIAMAFASLPAAAVQAQWQRVASGGGETVSVDLGRISVNDAGRVQAWSRLALTRPVADPESGESYNVVEVLNAYDCDARRYAPVKRIYLRGEKMLKVEPIYAGKDQSASPGLDAALMKEVCRAQPTVALQQKKDAAKTAPAADTKFSVMHAELVTDPRDAKNGTSTKVASTADKPADSGRIEQRRMIDLPKIDKSQVEKPTDTKPGDKAAEKVGEKVPEKASEKLADKGKIDRVEKAKPDAMPHPIDATLSGIDKHTRELALATTGPRRIIRKKPVPVEPAIIEHAEIHWAYEGPGAPENWSKINQGNALCGTGRRQSPIDIGEGIRVDLEPIQFDYKPTYFRIEDNGHTIQVTPAEGNVIKVMGRTYELKQFHFHRPSEEKVNGKRFDMVVHLVHKDDEGNLAVVAVLLEKGEKEQSVIQTLWNNMPLEQGQSLKPNVAIDLNQLLPQDRAYYTYMGSLTTPPCTEGVLWMVFKQPMIVTPDQVSIFSRLYRNNARPIQPGFGRLVKESR